MIKKTITIKPEFQGLTITKNIFAIGMVTFDTNRALQEHYDKYIKLGFGDIFDVIEEEIDDVWNKLHLPEDNNGWIILDNTPCTCEGGTVEATCSTCDTGSSSCNHQQKCKGPCKKTTKKYKNIENKKDETDNRS